MSEHYDSDPAMGCGMMLVILCGIAFIIWVLAVYGAAHLMGLVR